MLLCSLLFLEGCSQEHEYLLIGILPYTLNTITLKAIDQNGNSAGTYSGTEGEESYYVKYLVNEEKGTYQLIERIPVTYSGYVSSVQELNNTLLIDSGSAFTAVELDQNNQIIQTLKGTGDTWWYRVFKYDYIGFWFGG